MQCKDILLLPTLARAKLIAGKSGLGNPVRWCYKAETMEFADWVHGRELLIISSAVISSRDFDIERVVKEAIRLKLSGVLLLVGEEYIQRVPGSVRALADRHRLPMIGLPGKIPLVDVFEEIGHAIAYQNMETHRSGDLLSGIIFGDSVNKELLEYQAKLMGYEVQRPQRIFMVHIRFDNPALAAERMQEIREQLREHFQKGKCPVVLSSFNCNLIGMTSGEQQKLEGIFSCFMDDSIGKEEDCRLGVGSICHTVKDLKESFQEASRCIALAENSVSESPVLWFDQLGFIRVLLSLENQEAPLQFMQQILGPILRYDETSGGHLMETVQTWFSCDENMKLAAERLFTHPNTIKYRLVQVEKLTGLQLSKNRDKLELQNALLIRNYLYQNRGNQSLDSVLY
ncbi:MAG: PucR family transcriptional regulator ligand-binding domain-containing protein [Lachnospiraceae bacterium]|nr:PucR family transcriptional regulator ligand-binding domain-containing protein [Lachnospiraceae bacterium]